MNDHLDIYKQKRDFSKTPEPAGGTPSVGALSFVVQKHAATALHYDVRFEVDGFMPSWAVPKGPSYDPKVRRLAIHTEDHPLDYQTFEGVIPKGEYGGGRVIVWDRGTYEHVPSVEHAELDMRASIDAGHFSVFVRGDKLNGEWTFIRTNKYGGKDSWVMIKKRDDFAQPDLDITTTRPESVASGSTIESIGKAKSATPTTGDAQFVEPMLAQPNKIMPDGDEWIYERKLDGLRCVAVRHGDNVTLWSRNQLSFNKRFPAIIEALKALPANDFVLDGEIVAFDKDGHTSFSLLQQHADAPAELHLFDLLHLLGQSTRDLPLLDRKTLLAQAVVENDVLHLVHHVTGDANKLLAQSCADEWEGLVAKRADSIYRSGRSPNWLKLKCTSSQELVIAGWTEPKGARRGFGALLMGYYQDGQLQYAGKVGTGFSSELLSSLYGQLAKLEITKPAFTEVVKERGAHWAQPQLVANIGFSEWTPDGKLRHPRFEGLRPDKEAKDIVRER